MSLYKRAGVWHYDFTINGRRHRGSTKLRGKTAAAKFEERQKELAALGSLGRAVPNIEEASARWFQARVAGRKSEATTAIRLEIMLRLIGPQTPVTMIDTPEIEDAMQRRRLEPIRDSKKLPTNSTVNRDLIDTTLRPILRYCRKTLKLPVADIEWRDLRLHEPRGRNRTFTQQEVGDWRLKLPAWHQDLYDFMKRYGVRLSEAFFPPSAYDPATARITVRKRKNGLDHVVTLLPDDARAMAARMGRAQAAKLETVWFRELKSGKLRPIKPRGFQSASRRALDGASIADARPAHDLRHHAATAVLRAPRGNLKVVQKLLGHENIASTARYAHADDDDVLEALRHVSDTTAVSPDENPNDANDLPDAASGT